MTSKYVTTVVYLTPEQRELVQKLCPQGLSKLVRECLDLMISDQAQNPDPQLPVPVQARLIQYQAELTARQDHQGRRDQLKCAFGEYLRDHHIPVIFARNGRRKARRAAKLMVRGFRSEGHILSDHLVSEFITEYLDRIEISGEVEQAWVPIQARLVEEGV